jgi:hypothetical protein
MKSYGKSSTVWQSEISWSGFEESSNMQQMCRMPLLRVGPKSHNTRPVSVLNSNVPLLGENHF